MAGASPSSKAGDFERCDAPWPGKRAMAHRSGSVAEKLTHTLPLFLRLNSGSPILRERGIARSIVPIALVVGLGLITVTIWASSQPQKVEDADGSVLRAAHWQALHPARRIIHRGQLLGVIQVPRLALNVPIVEGSDNESLDLGAGHIPQTAFPGNHGNAGIAAHRDTCFRALRFVRPDDDILITTPAGAYDYAVTRTRIVMPQDGHVLHRTPTPTLTLVTCYPFFYVGPAPKRFIVHAERR